jgi:carbamoyl-phosphate synthase large subunit
MKICYNRKDIQSFLGKAAKVSEKHPVTVSKFVEDAKEIEFDAVACNGNIKVYGISEHVEMAGVHSGDATVVFPADLIYIRTQQQVLRAAKKLARAYDITGPFNIQFLAKGGDISVIEMNLRASRTFPLISKALNINFSSKIIDAIFNNCTKESYSYPLFSLVKVPQFSFSRLHGADPILHVEMASTGEVGCFAPSREIAYLSALLSVDHDVFSGKRVLLSLGDAHKEHFLPYAHKLQKMGFSFVASQGTAMFLESHSIHADVIGKVQDRKKEDVLNSIQNHDIDLVINLRDKERVSDTYSHLLKERSAGYQIRRAATDHNIPLFTNVHTTRLLITALEQTDIDGIPIMSWQEYLQTNS